MFCKEITQKNEVSRKKAWAR